MYSEVKSCNEGIKALQCEDYQSAITKFSIGLAKSSDPKDRSILLCQRSSAYLGLEQFDNAVNDAKECVRTRPQWAKGYLTWGKALETKEDYSGMCNVYLNAIKRGGGLEEVLMKPLLVANEKYKVFTEEFIDVLLLGGSKYCELCREAEDLLRCSRCRVVYYCSQCHQKEDWSKHKKQCGILADAHNYLLEEKELDVSKSLPWMILKKPFTSLTSISDWEKVWRHLECVACTSDVFYRRMSESMSWCLTLVKAICKFDLANKERLVVHILGADDTYNKEGYYTYFTGFFPFPDMELILVGPDILHNTSKLEFKSASGSQISISYVADAWHNFKERLDYKKPDLVFAAHPGIHEEFYDWEPTITQLVTTGIPTVFTTWHKEDLEETLRILKLDTYNAGIVWDGVAPFASLVRRYARKAWNVWGVQVMNSHWVGFRGSAS